MGGIWEERFRKPCLRGKVEFQCLLLGAACSVGAPPKPPPQTSPDLGPIPNDSLLATGLAWPVSAPPAGGEGQSLQQQQQLGLWVIAGFLTFLALEKMFLNSKEKEGPSQVSHKTQSPDMLVLFFVFCF